jgi:1,4-dihydroxy-2-naphthoate octaprenyltransferase
LHGVKDVFGALAGRLLRRSKRPFVLASLRAFVRLSRFTFLAGGIAGGALGSAVAAYESGGVAWPAYGIAQLTISAFHLMTHYANDYFDRSGDALAVRTAFSGGSGALVDGSLAPVVALRASLACAAVGALAALSLWRFADAPLAALLAGAIALLAWSYSAPPLRLSARGLGELDTVLVVALLVPLCAFAAQRHAIDLRALAATIPGAAAMLAMMLAVEFPDLATDAASGKRNLLVRLGAPAGARLGAGAVAAIYAAAAGALVLGAPLAFGLAIAATLPLSFGAVRALRRRGRGEAREGEGLAGRGVALFFIVTAYGALAFATAAGVHAGASGASSALTR